MRFAVFFSLAILVAPMPGQTAPAMKAADTAYRLGVRHELGQGVPKDYARAMELYCDADRLGHFTASFNIGWMYANGRGVFRDDSQAAAWFRRAEERGNPQAGQLLKAFRTAKDVLPMCPAKPGRPPTVVAADAKSTNQIVALVKTMAPAYRIDPDLALAVVRVESAFQTGAVSPMNAQGLMQLIPETAARFGVKDAFDPVSNLHGGLSYLRWLIDYFGGDLKLALAGYNAGEGAVDRHGGVPPYRETREYIQKIAAIYPALNAKRWNWPSAKDADIGKVGLKLDVAPNIPREGL
jgi:hypothetical protein